MERKNNNSGNPLPRIWQPALACVARIIPQTVRPTDRLRNTFSKIRSSQHRCRIHSSLNGHQLKFWFIVTEQLQALGITPDAILLDSAQRNTAPAILAAALNLAQ